MSRGIPEKFWVKVGLNEVLLDHRLASRNRIELTGTLLLCRLYLRNKYRYENVEEAWSDADMMLHAEQISGDPKKWNEFICELIKKGLLFRNENGFWGDKYWGRHQGDAERLYFQKSTKEYRKELHSKKGETENEPRYEKPKRPQCAK